MSREIILTTGLPLPPFSRGKVRDAYDLGERLLIVASDRISAFDVVLPNGIPDKGRVLNQLSVFWFRETAAIIPNHLIASLDTRADLASYLPKQSGGYPDYLLGRSMVVRKAERLPVECVVRGYLSGSAWAEYQERGTVNGEPMPRGLRESQALAEPLFTPTTKADAGHDLPINRRELAKEVGAALAEELAAKSLAIYRHARDYALAKGIIVADTKMEFGLDSGRLILIDELLTPDSSRFWEAKLYRVGLSQPSYDKQPVRDWLAQSGWNKEPPAPGLPPEVVNATSRRYREAYERLTGKRLG